MSDKPYSPLGAVRRATRAMNSYNTKHAAPSERPLTLETTTGPIPCAVLLRSFTENGPVPDDFAGIPRSGAAIKEHVRPDGAVFLGAFEVQGDRSSVVLVYGPPTMTTEQAEQVALLERPALAARHESFLLGPFAAHPVVSPSLTS